MDKLLIYIIAIFLIGGSAYFILKSTKSQDIPQPAAQINSFEECAAKYPVMESYPRQCNTPEGKHFTENIGNANELADLIVVDSPRPNETIKSPITIIGKARGTWFFEASFPIKIYKYGTNTDGTADIKSSEIGTGIAQAKSDWMTQDFVEFSATIEFTKPANPDGAIVLMKDNPSGLEENDNQLLIPVKF